MRLLQHSNLHSRPSTSKACTGVHSLIEDVQYDVIPIPQYLPSWKSFASQHDMAAIFPIHQVLRHSHELVSRARLSHGVW